MLTFITLFLKFEILILDNITKDKRIVLLQRDLFFTFFKPTGISDVQEL